MKAHTKVYKYKLIVYHAFAVTFWLVLHSCKQMYVPEIKDINIDYLVLEGLINVGTDSTIYTLSHTFKLNGKAIVNPEKAAIVRVESEGGAIYVLPETAKPGKYGRPSLGLDPSKKYRLRIRTKDNKEYLSDFVESKISPPITELTYNLRNGNLNIYANTRDATGNSRYYRYNGVETWEYMVPLTSLLKVENHQIIRRSYPDEYISHCWHSSSTSGIVLGSSANLTEDRLADKLVLSIPPHSEKLFLEYSILIKQTVLTPDGFQFWESLKKNTENVGNLFDAQPSQLFGNIRSLSNPADKVIGFVSAGTVSEKRFTIKSAELPAEMTTPISIDSTCIKSVTRISTGLPLQTLVTGPVKSAYTLLDEIWVVGVPYPVAYNATDILTCADCRALGGINIKPSYWR